MNKRIIRRALIISLLSLAGFFVLVTTVNQQIVHQQARDLRRVGRTYAASSHDGVNRKHWQSQRQPSSRSFPIIRGPRVKK